MDGSSGGQIGPPEPHIIETEIRGDISLYDPTREQVLVLNGTASDVWRLCDGTQPFETIVSLLARAYGVEETQIEDDVRSAIENFVDEGFLPER